MAAMMLILTMPFFTAWLFFVWILYTKRALITYVGHTLYSGISRGGLERILVSYQSSVHLK